MASLQMVAPVTPYTGESRELGVGATEPGIKRRQASVVPGVRATRCHATHKFAQCDNDARAELTEWFFFSGGVEAKMRREGSQ
jgi:hypothetical protein